MLTKRQREIYNFIIDHTLSNGFQPTIREIGEEFDIRSPNGVTCHLRALDKKGLIDMGNKSARAMRIPALVKLFDEIKKTSLQGSVYEI